MVFISNDMINFYHLLKNQGLNPINLTSEGNASKIPSSITGLVS